MPTLHRIDARSAGQAQKALAEFAETQSYSIGDMIEIACSYCGDVVLTYHVAEGPAEIPMGAAYEAHGCAGMRAARMAAFAEFNTAHGEFEPDEMAKPAAGGMQRGANEDALPVAPAADPDLPTTTASEEG